MTIGQENQLNGSEADRFCELGQVAGELMHDLANVVAVVHGRASLALSDAQAGRSHTAELEHLVSTSDELSVMLRDVLETLRSKALSPEVMFSPLSVAERVIRRFTEGASPVELRLFSSLPADARIAGRASFLARALQNLLGNAARYARAEIQVRLSLVELPGDAGAGELTVIIEVADDGPGIADASMEDVFRPLRQGEKGGAAGLGLSSVRWAVGQLRGKVRCCRDAALGGAAFEIRMPAVGVRRDPVPARAETLRGQRLVLIEDDAAVERAMVRLLGRMGADVVPVGFGRESEEDLLQALIRALPDALLLDLKLGYRQGIEIWRMLDAQVPALARRVIFLSGMAPGDPLWEAAVATGQPVLAKPVDVEALADAVAEVAGSK